MITPFDPEGRVDVDGYIANLFTLKGWGLTGAVLMGSSGEFPHLTFEERRTIIREAGRAGLEDFRLLAHAGGLPFEQVRALVEEAAREGLDGSLVITPYYFVPHIREDALTRYYTELMGAGDIVLYHYPLQTGVTLGARWVAEMAERGMKGMKDTSGNTGFMAQVTALAPPGFRVYGGLGSSLIQALAAGAAGGILALSMLAPKACLALAEAFRAGRIPEAQGIQRRLVPLDQAAGARWGIAGLKWAAGRRGLVSSGPRLPLLPLSPAGQADIEGLLEDLDLAEAR